jgi:protein-histidine pros-kinase
VDGDGELVLAVRAPAPPEGPLSDAIEAIVGCLGRLSSAERRPVGSGEEHRELLRRLFEVTEEEQKRMSAEIHDRLGAHFFDFYYGLRQCQEIVGDLEPSAAAILADLVEKARLCAREVRALTDELRPAALDDFGFAEALAELLSHLDRTGELRVELAVDPETPRPAPETAVALYRIAREAVLNARKHACARRLRVRFGRDGRGGLELRIADDGVGFDPDVRVPDGHGLLCMRERAAAIGGSVRIESGAGAGTAVVIVVPDADGGS